MSKRAGTVVTMEDLVSAVGIDAARYALVRSSADSTLDIDLDLLTKATNDNPVFYVQYAHARTVNVGRNAADLGVARDDGFDPALLDHASEAVLLGVLGGYSRVSDRPRSCASRIGSRAISRSWPARTTSGTTSGT